MRESDLAIHSAASKRCACCAKVFSRPPAISATQWNSRKYCSKKCSGRRLPVPDDEIVRRYRDGESSSQIAALFGVSSVQICRIIRAAGVTRSASEGKILSHSCPEVRRKLSVAATGRRHKEAAKDKLRARVGPIHHSWKSGLSMTAGGYLAFTASPANGVNAARLLHQVIAEWTIGRPLQSGEHVHHIDGNKLNNHPENLAVMTASDHIKLHFRQRREELANA
jgi:hypothetical protein